MAFLDKLKLRTRLFVSFTLAVLLTFGVGSAMLFSVFYFSVKESTERNLSNTSNMIFNMIELAASSSLENYLLSSVTSSLQGLDSIYKQYETGLYSENEAKAIATQYILSRNISDHGYMIIMDTNSKIIAHPSEKFVGINISDIHSIKETKKEYGNYIEYDFDPKSTPKKKALYQMRFPQWNWLIAATAQRQESQNMINIENIKRKLNKLNLGRNGYVFIIDTLGKFVYHPYLDTLQNHSNKQSYTDLKNQILEKKNGSIDYLWTNPETIQIQNKIIHYRYIEDLNWIVAASMYHRDVYAPLDKTLNIIILTFFVSVVILLIISTKYSSYLLDPIKSLNDKFKMASHNDFSVRMEYNKEDELGELSKHFNLFMEQLNEYYDNLSRQIRERLEVEETLKEYQEDLEQKVVMRTTELVNLNDKLKMEVEFRKEIAENLKESEEQYKVLFENTDNIIFLIVKNRIEIANSSFVETFVPENLDNIRNLSFTELFEASVRKNFLDAFTEMQQDKTKSISFEFKTKDNTAIDKYFEANINAIHYKASLAFLVSIADITSKKFMEGRIMQTQKMESIGQLAAGIAHEINTPMQFIGDNNSFLISVFDDIFEYIEMLKRLITINDGSRIAEVEKLEEKYDINFLKQETPEALFRTQSGVQRISKIVSAMKKFAHPSGKEMKLSDINQGIDVTITISKNEWKYVAEIETNYDKNLPLISCYFDELNQVILNMIVNAAHAIEEKQNALGDNEKGTIKISTLKDGDFVKIIISDTGVGISEENKYKIFDPFFTTKEVGKGTGQGLSIAYDIIVNKHFGNIDIKSEIGVGSSFIISLPIKDIN